ncbi:hypothetical protein B0T14DRAFT_179304 [Immersiella caudata]|uniref:Uncharacterized protein n=1 Tax=Immersiella caudata TaxID=314043 RepID=A0AA39WXM3_9PEZI|nr:hypothetical protein B0T14DRAFT_179304 [Immersiella caudata]
MPYRARQFSLAVTRRSELCFHPLQVHPSTTGHNRIFQYVPIHTRSTTIWKHASYQDRTHSPHAPIITHPSHPNPDVSPIKPEQADGSPSPHCQNHMLEPVLKYINFAALKSDPGDTCACKHPCTWAKCTGPEDFALPAWALELRDGVKAEPDNVKTERGNKFEPKVMVGPGAVKVEGIKAEPGIKVENGVKFEVVKAGLPREEAQIPETRLWSVSGNYFCFSREKTPSFPRDSRNFPKEEIRSQLIFGIDTGISDPPGWTRWMGCRPLTS